MLKDWDSLPENMRTDAVRPYYDCLKKKGAALTFKRVFDLLVSAVMIVELLPVLGVIALWIKLDSPGPVFFRQERVTQYGRVFRIFKFRTMVNNAEKLGSGVTVSGDARITAAGRKLRHVRLDELPQLFNILLGDMSFVGTRPESVRYVKQYTPEMMATLLLPAGVTSEASILYKDEDALLAGAEDADAVYIHEVLPEKMRYNLENLRSFSLMGELRTMFRTVGAVLKG